MKRSQNKNLLVLAHNNNAGKDRKNVVVLEGSARSGKTYSTLIFIIMLCMKQKLVVSVFRADQATHDKGALRDFNEIMLTQFLPVWQIGKMNKSSKTFTFPNGSLIEFVGTNDAAKLHGGARDIAFFNEVIETNYEAYRQIIARTRKLVIVDFNPSLSKHWIFDRVLSRPDVVYCHSTYKDNPHLDPKIVFEIEATEDTKENRINGTADAYFWNVYGLGKRAKREGSVFKEYFICEDEEWPVSHIVQRHGFGLDFGFSADPCAFVECSFHQSRLYLRQHVYETGLITCRSHANPNTPSIQGEFEAMRLKKTAKIVGDSSRPEQIAELNAEGYCVTGVKKFAGSIVAGIDLMKRYPIYIHRDSTDLQQEFDQYAWRRKPDGAWINEPEDRFNHGIDAARYWVMEELTRMAIGGAGAYPSRQARKLRRYR